METESPTTVPQCRTPYQVTFLLDKSNNWIENHLVESTAFLSDTSYNFQISHDHLHVDNQDIVFILGYTKILNNNFLVKNRLNLVIHESDLPLGKGFAPVQWQILDGKKEIPICLLEATEQIDSGDILFKSSFNLSGYELYTEIRLMQAKATFKAISEFLNIYPNFTRTKQLGNDSFYPRRTTKDSELNIDKPLREQFNLLRIGNNEDWPSFFFIDDQKYILKIYKQKNS
jgi:methionyl-tRNA formyltransferase